MNVTRTPDRTIPLDALRFMAGRGGSQRTVELQGASHAVAVTSLPDVGVDVERTKIRS